MPANTQNLRHALLYQFIHGLLELLNGLEKFTEITLSKPAGASSLLHLLALLILITPNTLDDLKESSWAISHRLGKHLQQDSLVISISKEAQVL